MILSGTKDKEETQNTTVAIVDLMYVDKNVQFNMHEDFGCPWWARVQDTRTLFTTPCGAKEKRSGVADRSMVSPTYNKHIVYG